MRKYVIYTLLTICLIIFSSCAGVKSSADKIVIERYEIPQIETETTEMLTSSSEIDLETTELPPETEIALQETETTTEKQNVDQTTATTEQTKAVTQTQQMSEKRPETEAEPAKTTEKLLPKSDENGKYFVIVNMNSMVYHTNPQCSYARKIAAENRMEIYVNDISELDASGCRICSYCAKSQHNNAETTEKHKESSAQTIDQTEKESNIDDAQKASLYTVIINKNSKTFHINPNCSHVKNMKEENKLIVETDDIASLIADGYKPCGSCAKEYKTN
ncbi:MAG: hypothetical protein WCQ72_06470 [Eubacteriales bacterium]